MDKGLMSALKNLTIGQKVAIVPCLLLVCLTIHTVHSFGITPKWLDLLIGVILFVSLPILFAMTVGTWIAAILDLIIEKFN